MGLDPELVREAERAKEQVAVAQHAAYRAKVDYHQAIRRLHAAGGSLREVAEALRLSQQRVHQIIEEAAEPTRRRWRREPQLLSGPVGPCWFRGRPRDVCAKRIAGPGVFICDRCVIQATRLAAGSAVEGQAEGSMRLEPSGPQARCSFCNWETRKVRHLVASGLPVCRQVRRSAPDLRQVPGPVPGDSGRDLACLSCATPDDRRHARSRCDAPAIGHLLDYAGPPH